MNRSNKRILAKSRPKYGKPRFHYNKKSILAKKNKEPNISVDTLWQEIRRIMEEELEAVQFYTWIYYPIRPISFFANTLILEITNQFFLEYIQKRYLYMIQSAGKAVLFQPVKVELVLAKTST